MVYSRFRPNASLPGPQCPELVGTAKCPEPLCPRQVLPLVASRTTSEGITSPSLLLRTHPPILIPPPASRHPLGQWVFAGCCQPLLGVGPSRRYLCESFPTCPSSLGRRTKGTKGLDPYPGCSRGAFARFFPFSNLKLSPPPDHSQHH